jgi:hypothetical protein|tara:strand:- start:837 stop:986 length:150 start_codon:yes stop_codon:yes gene_type:complete
MIELFNAAWPVIIAVVGLIIVLAKMHGDIEVLKDKIRTLFDIINSKGRK